MRDMSCCATAVDPATSRPSSARRTELKRFTGAKSSVAPRLPHLLSRPPESGSGTISKGAVMAKNDGQQKGPQKHAEGQHGDAAHAAFIDEIHGKHGGSEESE